MSTVCLLKDGFVLVGSDKVYTKTVWTPAQISTSLWLDASDASTITMQTTGVSAWNDKSGNNNHVTQVNTLLQPTYSNNEISFPISTLASVLSSTTAINMLASNGSSSFIAVHRIPNFAIFTAPIFNIFRNGSTSTGVLSRRPFVRYQRSGTLLEFYNATNTFDVQTNIGGIINNNAIIGFTVDGPNTDSFGYLNGTLFGSNPSTIIDTNTTLESVSIGNLTNQLLPIIYSEVVFFNSALSTDNRQKVEGYLAWKWNLVSNLPITHPYKNMPPI